MQLKTVKTGDLLLAIRPKTLLVSFSPMLLSFALAKSMGEHNLEIIVLCLLTALFLQIACNLCNDLCDFLKGADEDRVGPKRASQSGLFSKKQMISFISFFLILSLCSGIPLIIKGGLPFLFLAVFSIFAAFAYTSGPFPLAYNGLGDVFVFLVFGPLACFGSYFLQTENLNMEIIVCSLALGCLAVNILVVNNLRDLHNDKKVNKNTLAVLLGHEMTRYQYLILALVSFMAPVFLALKNKNPMLFIPLLLLPFAFNLIMEIFQKEDADLNPVLGKTALLQFLFACFFSLGFLL